MLTLKKINIKYQPYYFLSDMINIKNFDSSLLSIDKTSLKSIDAVTYHINIWQWKFLTMEILTWFLLLQKKQRNIRKVHKTLGRNWKFKLSQ